ncbi:MAG: hypothetical protein H7144_04870 [Burkholderiales bacterium]|nr:hypothetical protein [Phycisphaerae bacterium]
MLKKDVKALITREPFVPYRIYLQDGRLFDVPFREVAHFLSFGVLVFIGMKQGSRRAENYDRFAFENISRIEDTSSMRSARRKKAS